MQKDTFNLLKCNPIDDMIYVANLIQGTDYVLKTTDKGIEYYSITLSSSESKQLYECLKDLDIYIPSSETYLSDFILMNVLDIKPSDIAFINTFNIDALFTHTVSRVKIIRAKRKTYGMKLLPYQNLDN